jgi:RND superfamily putative drug exporter
MESFGRWIYRFRGWVLGISLLLVVGVGVVGFGVFGQLQTEGFTDDSSASTTVERVLADDFAEPATDAFLLVRSPGGDVTEGSAAAVGQRLTREVASLPGVASVRSPWAGGGGESLVNPQGDAALILMSLVPDEEKADEAALDLRDNIAGTTDGVEVLAGGASVAGTAVAERIGRDLVTAELIAIPITFVLLLFVFGGLIAAGLPVLVGVSAILLSFGGLLAFAMATDVSIYAVNLITGLGLALGIDYALLIVSRFREELRNGADVESALGTTVATAGRTVIASGLVVAVTMAGFLFFPLYFLRSFGYAGLVVVLAAVLGAIFVLCSLLAILGPRVNRLTVWRRSIEPRDTGFWASMARRVMRRPVLWGGGAVAVLVVLSLPALGVVFGPTDERSLPADDPAAVAGQSVRTAFVGNDASPIEIVFPAGQAPADGAAYARQVSQVQGVEAVVAPDGVFTGGQRVGPAPDAAALTSPGGAQRIVATSSIVPGTGEARGQVADIRDINGSALVGGVAAEDADTINAIAGALPAVITWVVLSVLVLLFLYTGSLLLPLKAVVMNFLGLAATLGILVWIFQEGHLTWLVGGFTVTGTVDTSMVVLTAIVAFALAMDYELFLISRIREEWLRTGDNEAAVAFGMQRSGRIVTAAAILIAVVFGAFITSSVTNIKLLGLGVALAILIDATIIRGVIVPAFMRIAGKWNWWAPAWLRKVHDKVGLTD